MFKQLSALFARPGAADHPLRQTVGDDARPTVLVSLLLADPDTCAAAVARHAQSRTHRAVFAVTLTNLRAFWSAGCPAEYFPSPDEVAAHRDAGPWRAYLTERWRLVRTKWRPAWIVNSGMGFEDYLERCDAAQDHDSRNRERLA